MMVSAGFNSAPVNSAEKQPLCRSTGLYVIIILQKRGRARISGRFVHVNKSTSLIISHASNSCGDLAASRVAIIEISSDEVPLPQ